MHNQPMPPNLLKHAGIGSGTVFTSNTLLTQFQTFHTIIKCHWTVPITSDKVWMPLHPHIYTYCYLEFSILRYQSNHSSPSIVGNYYGPGCCCLLIVSDSRAEVGHVWVKRWQTVVKNLSQHSLCECQAAVRTTGSLEHPHRYYVKFFLLKCE